MTELRQRQPRVEDAAYLKKVRCCPCISCGEDVGCDAAHVRMGTPDKPNAGVGAKPDDMYTLPLCRSCHLTGAESQHHVGERKFWHDVGIDPIATCRALYKLRDNLDAMRARVFAAVDRSPWI